MATRWGIMCAGLITEDFVGVLNEQNPEEHQVVGIAARSLDRARAFAEKFGIKNAYGTYEELANCPDVEIIYVSSVPPEHFKLCMMSLNAGKHVLCEKPITMTLAAAEELFRTAKEKKLFCMEGFWTRFFPAFDKVRSELASGALGEIFMVQSSQCVSLFDVSERFRDKQVSGGCTLEVGCYTIMEAEFVYKQRPKKIIAECQVDETGLDMGGVVTLRFPGGQLASLTYSSRHDGHNNRLVIIGTKGTITVGPIQFCPTKVTCPSGTFEYPLPVKTKFPVNYPNAEGFYYEQQCVRDCLQKGLLECPLMTHESSQNIQYVMQEVAKQIGVTYDYPYTV